MHDAVELERRGIPAVAICTEEFRHGGAAIAEMRGAPNYPFALVPHPLGVLDDEALAGRARVALPQVVEILTRHPQRPEA